jgi:hypothetical protein
MIHNFKELHRSVDAHLRLAGLNDRWDANRCGKPVFALDSVFDGE